MRNAIVALPVALLLLFTAGPVAVAAPAADQRIDVIGRVEDPTATIIANGEINGTGSLTAESVEFDQPTKTYLETDLAAVGGGTLTILVHGAFDTWPFTLDPRTCTNSGRIFGTWTITAAGGDLTGATGGGTLSGRFLTYASHDATGCDLNDIKGFVAGPMVGNIDG